jgi:hypothetical protein
MFVGDLFSHSSRNTNKDKSDTPNKGGGNSDTPSEGNGQSSIIGLQGER